MQELLDYAAKHDVPIIQQEGLTFLLKLIREEQIHSVLEIGTAIGYSAINMALCGAQVTTIERDFDYYCLAYDNVRRFALQHSIQLIYADAMLYQTERQFDLLFIDGAKAQSIAFLQQYRHCLHSGSYVLVDNINFHNCTYGEEKLSRDLRELTAKIRRYVDYILQEPDFQTRILDIGDGLCLSRLIA